MALRHALSFFLVAGLGFGCAANSSGNGGGGNGGDGNAGDGGAGNTGACAPPIFTGEACPSSEIGMSCQGTAECGCQGGLMTAKASCTCQMKDRRAEWVCEDSVCEKQCPTGTSSGGSGGSGAGGSDPGAPAGCVAFYQAFYHCQGVDDLSVDTASTLCAQQEDDCGDTLNPLLACIEAHPIVCDNGSPTFPGCTNRFIAFGNCIGAG